MKIEDFNNTKPEFIPQDYFNGKLRAYGIVKGILDAVMDALAAFTAMSRQALESERIRAEIKSILLGPGRLYETLREAAEQAG